MYMSVLLFGWITLHFLADILWVNLP